MNKALKIGAISVVSAVVLGVGGLLAFQGASVYAATPANTVFEKVLEKLGIKNVTADQLKTAFDTSKQEVMQTNIETKLNDAVTAKTLTEDQANLAKKLFALRETKMAAERAKIEAMTDAEREAARATRPTPPTAEETAKELGVSVTDLTNLETALRNAGIGGRDGRGMGMGRGMGEGGMMRGL